MADQRPPKKSLGQHWLYDKTVLADIVRSVDIQPNDTVLEIGPGLGTLTAELVQSAKRVIAVEFDERLAANLASRLKAANLQIISQDILSFDFTSLSAEYKLVANIPYYLTSNLIRVLSETSNPPAAAALLVQKEVAQRVAAQPGDMSILSVTAQFYWQVSLGREVPAHFFEPAPKVDSQVVILKRRPELLFTDIDPKDLFRLVKAGFAQRRKTLLNSLSGGLHLSRDEVQAICQTANIVPNRRAQTLSLDEWHTLYRALHT